MFLIFSDMQLQTGGGHLAENILCQTKHSCWNKNKGTAKEQGICCKDAKLRLMQANTFQLPNIKHHEATTDQKETG